MGQTKREGRLKLIKGLKFIKDASGTKHFSLDKIIPFNGQKPFTLYWSDPGEPKGWIVQVVFSQETLIDKCAEQNLKRGKVKL